MKKSIFLGVFAFLFLSFSVSSAQVTSKSLIGTWQVERVELLTGDAALTESGQQMKKNIEATLSEELQDKSITFTSKICNDRLFDLGNVKWKFYKEDKQLHLIKEVQDGKNKLKDIKSYEANIEDGKLVLEKFVTPEYKIYLIKK